MSSTAVEPSQTTTAKPGEAGSAQLAERGIDVYKEQYCGICHQLSSAGTGGVFGPTHDGMGLIAEQRIHDPTYSGSATAAEEYIRESIVSPQLYVVPAYEGTSHRMPAYRHLREREIMAMVQMLLQQR